MGISKHRDYLEDTYDVEFIEDVRNYLDELRESGIVNMFGATPYVESKFYVDTGDARKLLSLWMDEFGK